MTALPGSRIPVIIVEEMMKTENHYTENTAILTIFRQDSLMNAKIQAKVWREMGNWYCLKMSFDSQWMRLFITNKTLHPASGPATVSWMALCTYS